MNIIHKLILGKARRALSPFYLSKKETDEKFPAYTSLLPALQDCYGRATYWHGTGRFHYKNDEQGRYGTNNFNETTDILSSILDEGVIRPHHEPWLKKISKIDIPTVSLTSYRMHARLYACLHLHEGKSLAYDFGTAKIWISLFKFVQLCDVLFVAFIFKKVVTRLFVKSNYTDLKKFLYSIKKTVSLKSILFEPHLIQSDIAGNYPILIGVDEDISILDPTIGVGKLETRADGSISLDHITHIEVPLTNLEETKRLLESKSISIKVIPLEFGEVYSSKTPLASLLGIGEED